MPDFDIITSDANEQREKARANLKRLNEQVRLMEQEFWLFPGVIISKLLSRAMCRRARVQRFVDWLESPVES